MTSTRSPLIEPPTLWAQTLVPGAPATGVRWAVSIEPVPGAAIIAGPTTATTTAIVSRGGDYTLGFAATDGAELPTAGSLSFSIKVVEAVVNTPGIASVDQAFTADGTMSSAGLALDGTPLPLTFAWSVTPASATIPDPSLPTVPITPTETVPHTVTLTVTAAIGGGAGVSHTATRTVTVV